jgi:hypothetical protein
MRENSEFYESFIDSDLDSYLTNMAKDGVWAGQPEMHALS